MITEEAAFTQAREEAKKSTCKKTHAGAIIVKNGKIIGRGHNMCSPSGEQYGEPVQECKRLHITPGERYELCHPVHCEETAVIDTMSKGEDPRGAEMYISGHYFGCENCGSVCRFVGIEPKNIKLDPHSAKEVKARYQQLGI